MSLQRLMKCWTLMRATSLLEKEATYELRSLKKVLDKEISFLRIHEWFLKLETRSTKRVEGSGKKLAMFQ